MIGWLMGVVRMRDPSGLVVIDCHGVGYQLAVSLQTLARIPEVGGSAELFVYTHVREDALVLYGFATTEERGMFLLLLSVPQIGPKGALTAVGGFPVTELALAIAGGERTRLEKLPGVGRKTAERILLDLKDKVLPYCALSAAAPGPQRGVEAPSAQALRREAEVVLTNLGWKAKAVVAALDEVLEGAEATPLTLDQLVRKALSTLMTA